MAQELERYRIEPTPPQLGGLGLNLKERVLNYLDQPLNTEDPIQNLASGVAEFIPGLSQELARRRQDKLGEYLGYLDYLPGGGIPAEGISIIAKRQKLINDLKRERNIQSKSVDPNELAASSKAEARIIKQLRNIDDKIDEAQTAARPSSMTPGPTYAEERAALVKEIEKAEDKLSNAGWKPDKPYVDKEKVDEALREMSHYRRKLKTLEENRKGAINFFSNPDQFSDKAVAFRVFEKGGNNARAMVKQFPEYAKEYINKGNVISPVKGVDYSGLRGLEPPGFTPNFPIGRQQGTLDFDTPKPKDPAPFNQFIYHGGPSGIETLRTPKLIQDDMFTLNKSTGGIYSVLDKTDPRLKIFGQSIDNQDMFENLTPALKQKLLKDVPKKSVYKISPEFKNIADAENLPPDFIEELIKIRDNINTLKGNAYDQALNQNTRNTLDLMIESPSVGAPSMINKPVGDIFRGVGYDSILFPPRKLMREESDTILSLSDEALQNFEELNLADLLKLRD